MSSYDLWEELMLRLRHPVVVESSPDVWVTAEGPVRVSDMTLRHLQNAIAMCERRGMKFPAIPAMKTRVALLLDEGRTK